MQRGESGTLVDHGDRLRPGVRVVRRGPDHVQVGLLEGRRVVLPRTSGVRRLLDALTHGDRVEATAPEVSRALLSLDEAGLLEPPRATGMRVALLGGVGAPPVGVPEVPALLEAAGLEVVASSDDAAVVLVLSPGELDRDRLDHLVRRGSEHLVVRWVDGGAVVGPYVAPGRTACLRCLDAHASERDPEHVFVTARYVTATALPGPSLEVAPVLTALGLAIRDLVDRTRGRVPTTWSRTLLVPPDGGLPVATDWRRHPTCGCSWSPGVWPSGTMEG